MAESVQVVVVLEHGICQGCSSVLPEHQVSIGIRLKEKVA